MDQIASSWTAMSIQRRIIVIAATVGMFLGVFFLARQAATPRMELLYAGLDPAAAGEVITALEARAVPFDVRGSAIFVDGGQRDALRMALAGEGLPANSAAGYELLDGLSGFGTTAQMFDAAYWRAKEGELARTITTSRHIKAARVHISNAPSGPFRPETRATASVTVTPEGAITPAQAAALRYLVASAVAGLAPTDVSVIDSGTGLIPDSDGPGAALAGGQGLSEVLRGNVLRLLEARVGAGNAQVEVTVETVTEREAITERVFDPDSRIAISSDSEETSTRAADSRSGAVTVASNLPEGDASAGGGASETNETRTREVVNYEVSETLRDLVREPGGIRRLSVAVLVNGVTQTNADGAAVWEPRGDDELEALRDLVASAIGFDGARGDQLTIRSLQFETVQDITAPMAPALTDRLGLDVMSLAQLGVVALVTLVLGLFVVRPLLLTRPDPVARAQIAPPDNGLPDFEALPPLNGELQDPTSELPPLPALPDLGGAPSGAEDPAQRLRRLMDGKQDESIEVLAQWMRDDAKAAP